MPVKIAELYAYIGAQDEEFQAAMGRVEQAVNRAGGLFSGFASFLGGAMKVAAGNLIAHALEPMVSSFADIAGSVVGMNASLEKTVLQFQTLTGSADKAREHVMGLFKFAAETPFETQPIIEASKYLQIFGGAALNTHETLRLLGDAAAATSNRINDVAFWVGRAYSAMMAGRPFGEAAMRLQEMGILSAEARTKLEKLQESGADGQKIWAALREELSRFGGAMKLQASTWEGLTSTISDNIKMFIATAGRPLFEVLKRMLQAMTDLVTSPAFEQAAHLIADVLGGAVDFLFGAVSRAASAVSDFGGRVLGALLDFARASGIADVIEQIAFLPTVLRNVIAEGGSLGDIVDAIAETFVGFVPDWVVEGIYRLGGALADVIEKFAWAIRVIRDVIAEGGSLRDALVEIEEGLEGIAPDWVTEGIYRLWAALEVLEPALAGLMARAQEAAASIPAALGGIPGAIGNVLAAAQDLMAALGERFGPLLARAVELIRSAVQDVFGTLAAWWKENGAALMADMQTIAAGILQAFQAVLPILGAVLAFIVEAIRFAFGMILDIASAVWPSIRAIIESTLNIIAAIIRAIAAVIRGDWEGFANALRAIAENLGRILVSVFDGAFAALRAIVNNIIGLFRGVDWRGIGRSVVEGIRDGVLSVAASLAEAAASVVRNAIESARRALGIRSPSRVAAEEIGMPIGEGVIEGVRRALGEFSVPLPADLAAAPVAAPAPGVVIHVYGTLITEDELASRLAGVILRERSRGISI